MPSRTAKGTDEKFVKICKKTEKPQDIGFLVVKTPNSAEDGRHRLSVH